MDIIYKYRIMVILASAFVRDFVVKYISSIFADLIIRDLILFRIEIYISRRIYA